MALPPSSEPFFLSLQEWAQIQTVKKDRKITEIETLLVIENSKDDYIFNAVIKKLIRLNIFDLSRISYLVILFLSPYIDNHLKDILDCDEDVSTSIINRIYETDKTGYLPPSDKTIGNIINLVLNQLIDIELFLNINIFILYLNLHNMHNYNNNVFIFKISQLAEIIANKIPNSTLSLLIMKTINKFGKMYENIFNDDIMEKLEEKMGKEYLDSKMTEIANNSSKNNELLDDFIVQMMGVFDASNNADNADNVDNADNFIIIWNMCKNHIVNIVRNSIKLFKVGLDLLIILLVKEQPSLKLKASCITNTIMNFLDMEIDLLDTKISI